MSWEFESVTPATLTGDAKVVFDDVVNQSVGVRMEPLAFIGKKQDGMTETYAFIVRKQILSASKETEPKIVKMLVKAEVVRKVAIEAISDVL